jgi:hypothetical protein
LLVGEYVKCTIVDKKSPTREPDVDVHNIGAWGEPTVNEAQYNRMISLHLNFFGWVPAHHHGNWSEYGVTHMAGGHRDRNGWWRFEGEQGIYQAGNRVNAELDRRYREAKSAYDAQVTQASTIAFPSVVFDDLVDQVNGLFKKLKNS